MRSRRRYKSAMPAADPDRKVDCIRLKKSLPGLQKPPFPNDFGQFVYENVSKEAWDQWLQESTRYINTYKVDLSSERGREFILKQLRIWLGIEEGQLAETAWVAPEANDSNQ